MTYYSLALYLYLQPLPAGIHQTSGLNLSKPKLIINSYLNMHSLFQFLRPVTQTTYMKEKSLLLLHSIHPIVIYP